ncbi:ubiquitin carboxyl-terminal hydrolase [Paraphysoderma sedebokerense]|nr:ubiquitin carboxyl-terminal hydrolase [Paraphysoderma sedebokerense]
MSNWCLIESDPGVFTELISKFGVKGVQVEEVWDLESLSMEELSPIFGFIFLFKYDGNAKDNRSTQSWENCPDVFFAKQVINNACATQAILSILMNNHDIELGEELSQFKQFTAEFPPDLKGLSITNSETMRTVHNSFARADPFVSEPTVADEKDDVFHFVAYVPVNGVLYELDGLKDGPVNLGQIPPNTSWVSMIAPIIQERIASYTSTEIRFNLLAVIKSRIEVYNEKLNRINELLAHPDKIGTNVSDSLPKSADQLLILKQEYENRVINEKTKMQRYHNENVRRRHNFIPLICTLLQELAKANKLDSVISQAEQKLKERRERDKASGNK